MKMKLFPTFAVAFAALLSLTTVSAHGGTITVVDLPATGTDAASGITNSKSYVCAFSFGNGSAGTVTNNGVPFTHFGWPGVLNNKFATTNATDPNYGGRVVLTTGGPAANKLAAVSSATQGNLAGQADGNMYTILTDLVYPGGVGAAGAWLQQEFDNLIPGDSYSLRIYYRYWGNAVGDRKQDVYFTGEGYKQPCPSNPVDIDAGGAHYLEYDFVAFATNVFCIMSNDIAGGASMVEAATLEYDTNTYAPFIVPGYDASAAWVGGNGVAQFSVRADGTSSLSYQWYSNSVDSYSGAAMVTDGNDYSGSTTATLTATNNLLQYYFVVVANNYGSVTSSIVQINPLPVITSQPTLTNVANTYVGFNMAATGFPPLTYQWYFNTTSNYSGATITTDGNGYSGSTTPDLQATTNLQDYYFVIVNNSYGSVTSSITAYNPYPVILTQPISSIVGNTVGFNVTAGGWPTLGYQWYFNTVSNYTGASVLTDGGGISGSTTTNVTTTVVSDYYYYYFVVASNYYGSITSSIAQAVSPLAVVAAGEPIWNQASQTNVMIIFSDNLDPVTAGTIGNYSLSPSATIYSATIVASNEVALTTSPLSGSYSLTVANVKDYLSGTMSPASTNVAVGGYPANIALWIKANTGVTADSSGNVSQWNDLSGNNNTLYTISGISPVLATNIYGDPVVHFTSTNSTEMDAFSSPSLAITNDISIIAVMNFAALGGANGEIVSKTGSGSGHNNIAAPYDYLSGATPGLLRGNGTSYGSTSATRAPSIGMPQILAVSESGNTVSHFLNGSLIGNGVLSGGFHETSSGDAGQDLTIGERADGADRLTGDMSELIIAGSAISSYDVTQLDNYLIAEHNIVFFNTKPTNILFSASGGNLTLSWPLDHTGWTLQSQTNNLSAGIGTNWVNVSGSSSTNLMVMPINLTNGAVFYRLIYKP